MKDQSKTEHALIRELSSLRQRIEELEQSELEHKRAEEALRESEGKYRLAFENTSDGIFTIDCNFNILSITPSVERQLGYKVEEVINRPFQDLNILTSESLTRAVSDVIQVLSGVEVTGAVYEFIAKDGTRKIGEVTGTPTIQKGRILGVTAVVRDITERKWAEEALHRSETKFRTLYDSTSDAVMLLDETGFFDCNKATLAIFGCVTREEFCQKHPVDLSPPLQPCGTDSMVLARQVIATAMEKGSNHFEWMHRRNDTGKTFPADVLLTAMELDGKSVIQAVVRDITERKRAEEALRKSEERFRILSEAAFEAIAIHEDGVLIHANEQCFEMFGYEPDEALGKEMMSVTTAPEALQDMIKYINSNGMGPYESIGIRKDGTRFQMEIRARKMTYNGRTARFAAIRDITERKELEEKIKLSEKKYRDIFEYVPIGLYQASTKGRFLSANAHAAKILGYSPEELIQSIDDIGTQIYCDPKARDKAFRLLKENGFIENFETKCRHKDGYLVWVSFNVRLVRDKRGNILYHEGSSKDITDRKQTEDELARYREGLEQLVKERTQELENKTETLEEVNIALKVLLQQRDIERKDLENQFVSNIQTLTLPYIEKLKATVSDGHQRVWVNIIEKNLSEIMAPMLKTVRQLSFTRQEIQVATLIREGKTTKEIAELMGASTKTVDTHRNHIRKKLGINNIKTNLYAYLQAIN